MAEKVVLWGFGEDGRRFLEEQAFFFQGKYEFSCVIDKKQDLQGHERFGRLILPPAMLAHLSYDKLLISSRRYEQGIREELTKHYHVSPEKIIGLKFFDDLVARALVEKYQGTSDVELQDVLSFYRRHGFNIYGSFPPSEAMTLVHREADGWPYILFEGKKMYFPKEMYFCKKGGQEYIGDILREQGDGSPHSYFQDVSHAAEEVGKVIVDAGVCEGNFALRFVEQAERIYLIEADPAWMEALKKTFAPYRDKVVFCQRYLSRYDSATTITLDTLVKEPIDFLKMDIEGAEIDALLGGKRLLQASRARCAICSYHRSHDEENIKFILQALGYRTATSHGYMFFPYDSHCLETLEFRRGVVYGWRGKED